MSHPTPPSGDDPRDPHLLAALRHAPDRDVAPPAQLTAAILGEAERAVRAPHADRRAHWRSVWARLWQPAPMAAFGSVAMAVLIGVLWSGHDLPDATPGLRREPTTATPAGKASAAPAPAAAVVAPVAAPPVDSAAERVTPTDRGDADAGAGRVARPGRERLRSAPAEREATPAAAAAAPAMAGATGKLAEPLPTQPVVPPPAAPALAQAPSPAAADARGQAAPVPEARRDALAKSLADAVPAGARTRSEQANLGAVAAAGVSPLVPAGAELDAALARDAASVRWRVTPGGLVAHEAAQRDWWSTLVRATQGRWRLAAADSPSGAEAVNLVLLIDGAPRGSFVFEAQALVWRGADGVAWRAPLAAETLREWRAALARW